MDWLQWKDIKQWFKTMKDRRECDVTLYVRYVLIIAKPEHHQPSISITSFARTHPQDSCRVTSVLCNESEFQIKVATIHAQPLC